VGALDECPNATGTASAREQVLKFLKDLLRNINSNLRICVTSRQEQDIQDTLNSLASGSRCMSLHQEGGQRKDVMEYICSFVHNDLPMRRWRTDDKELVIVRSLNEPRECHLLYAAVGCFPRYRTGSDGYTVSWTPYVGVCHRVSARDWTNCR
jgi:hypothetical protein